MPPVCGGAQDSQKWLFMARKEENTPPALTSPPETAKIVMGSGECGALSPHLQEGCS